MDSEMITDIETVLQKYRERLRALAPKCPVGFSEWQTGGGCTAWGREIGAYRVMITNECSVPDSFPVTIGVTDNEGHHDQIAIYWDVSAQDYEATVAKCEQKALACNDSLYEYFYKTVGVHPDCESLWDCPLDSVVGSDAKQAIDAHMRVIHQHEQTLGRIDDSLRESLIDALDHLVTVLYTG